MKFVHQLLKRHRFFLLLLIGCCETTRLHAQLPTIDVAQIPIYENIYPRTGLLKDSLHQTTPANLSIASVDKLYNKKVRFLNTSQTESDWWVCFRLQNTADTAVKVYFFPGVYAQKIVLYRYNDSLKQITPLPYLVPALPDSSGFRGIVLAPGQRGIFLANIAYVHTSANAMELCIIRDFYIGNFVRVLKIPLNNGNMYTYIITGILLMMIFYSMAVFILNGSIEFMYYACFAFFTGLLFFLKSFYLKTPLAFNYFFETYLDFVVQSLGVFFYFIFLRKFLETQKNFPFLNKLFIAGQAIIIISLSIFSWFNLVRNDFAGQQMIESNTKYVWLITTVIFIVYSVRRNNRMLNFLAAGHFFLLLFSVMSVVLIGNPNIFTIPRPSIWTDSIFYYEMGMTIELIFFLMALAFKNRHDIIERTRERERLVLENERKEFEKQLAIVEAKQEERNRISTDMHDELGSGVTAIRLMSEIVKTKMKDNTLPEIDKISSNANDLLSKMNTIIWTMSSSNDRLDNMIAYTRSYALEYFESTNIDCHFESAGEIPPTEMSGEKRRNVFLCVKETLNNIVKHAKASDVWIKVTVLPGKLEIRIHDNGVGINLQKLREFGNGLNNMKKRLESIEGSFSIANNGGTTTTITAPL
jgi:signal transduction histidine kinase